MRKLNSQKGFTIIEAVVAAGVFAVVVSASLGVYMATVQLDSKSRAERAVLQNARFIMDFLSKEIRNGSIDYSATQDANTLSLINQLDEKEVIDLVGSNIALTKGTLGTTNLNSDDVMVTRLTFILQPDQDPFDLSNDVHIQPHVTVLLGLESTNQKFKEEAKIDIESTFTVRQYPSRF